MKGYDLLKAIAENKIKDKTKVRHVHTDEIYTCYKNFDLMCIDENNEEKCYIGDTYLLYEWLDFDFEIVEEEINIQEIKKHEIKKIDDDERLEMYDEKGKMNSYTRKDIALAKKQNEIIQAIKQIDRNLNKFKHLYKSANYDV